MVVTRSIDVWLSELIQRAASANLNNSEDAPPDKMEDDDELIGVLPENARGLYFVMEEDRKALNDFTVANQEHIQAVIDTPAEQRTERQLEFIADCYLSRARVDNIEENFWQGVYEVFPQMLAKMMNDKDAYICEGWNIVLRDSEDPRIVVVGAI